MMRSVANDWFDQDDQDIEVNVEELERSRVGLAPLAGALRART